LLEQLHKVDSDLTFEFGPRQNYKRELVISAGGIRAVFPVVISLVDSAPKLARWKFIKFRQRKSLDDSDDSIVLNDVKVPSAWVYFSSKPDGDCLDVTLFIKNYNATSTYKQIGFLWLDHALGEYDVETKLAQIEFKALGSDQPRQLKPLRQLPLTVDLLRSQK
jgi:hypothetical protein